MHKVPVGMELRILPNEKGTDLGKVYAFFKYRAQDDARLEGHDVQEIAIEGADRKFLERMYDEIIDQAVLANKCTWPEDLPVPEVPEELKESISPSVWEKVKAFFSGK